MKKLLLTICSVAFISLAGMAQQDTTQTNQYRPIRPQPYEQPVDSVDINEDAREQGQDIRRGADTTGYEMERETEQPATDTLQGQSGNEFQRNPEQEQQGEERSNDMNQGTPPDQSEAQGRDASSDGSASMDGPASPQSEVEVLDSKEGPNNEVVYKINGELYYVDRNEKKLVRANESELKDSSHEVEIHEGTASEDNADRPKKKSRG